VSDDEWLNWMRPLFPASQKGSEDDTPHVQKSVSINRG